MQIWLISTPIALLCGVVGLALRRHQRPGGGLLLVLALLSAGTSVYSLFTGAAAPLPNDAPQIANKTGMPISTRRRPAAPPQREDAEFIGSAACRDCHQAQHATWHDSYHRTMTQVVSAQTVLAPFENVKLQSGGRVVQLTREGDDFYAEMIDPEWEAEQRQRDQAPLDDPAAAPRVRRRVVMSTGSHHFQTYWINGLQGNSLWQVPWVYHLPTSRWMPAEEAFVSPPGTAPRLTLWNDNCIQCHVVGGHPGTDESMKSFDSSVADYGVSCEACHGPGRRHVELQSSLAASSQRPTQGDSTIVNPAKLDHQASSQICGQCHSYFSFSDSEFWSTGFKYRAGDDLLKTRYVHGFSDDYVQGRPDLLQGYWDDGTMRIAGREFAAMDDSACYLQGELSCISCHAMHQYEENEDQLAPGMRGNQACLQCHTELADKIEEHTHHSAESSGSTCYNCHMPHTSFGLLKAIRSHRIDSPSARMTAEHARPNACNLCHADQTLQWTADHLQQWYGQDAVALSEEDKNRLVPAANDAARRRRATRRGDRQSGLGRHARSIRGLAARVPDADARRPLRRRAVLRFRVPSAIPRLRES